MYTLQPDVASGTLRCMKLSDLTLGQLRDLAARVPTTYSYLRHLAAGRRQASAEMAGRIEAATRGSVGRETLSAACKGCKYLKQCRKATK